MNIKSIASLFLVCFATLPLCAQQDPLYAQYLTNPLLFNPAYAGLNNALNASFSYRNQWAGFEGSPTTMNASAHLSLADNKVGAGVLLIQDQLGVTKTTEFHAVGAYKLQLAEWTVNFGMQFGLVGFRNDYSELTIDPDPVFAQAERAAKPNVGAGAIVKNDRWLLGLSVPRMLKTKIASAGQDFQLYNQHYYLFGSYVHYLGERLRLKPSLLLRGVQGAPVSADLNFNIHIDTRYSAGLFTRNFKAYGLLVQGWFFDKYRVGYAFEVPTSQSVGPQFTTHELTLGIRTAALRFHDRTFSEF